MAAKQLLLEQEAVDEVREAISSVSGKQWMIAVWCIDEDEAEQNGGPDVLRLVNRTTWRFPHNQFTELLRLLSINLREELSAREPPVPAPLEMASFVKSPANSESYVLDDSVTGELPIVMPLNNDPLDEEFFINKLPDNESLDEEG